MYEKYIKQCYPRGGGDSGLTGSPEVRKSGGQAIKVMLNLFQHLAIRCKVCNVKKYFPHLGEGLSESVIHNIFLPLLWKDKRIGNDFRRKAGFTLAEVLITLGIIGVIVAITMPLLTANYKKKELPVRLQKFYTTFNNALLMSQVYNGDISTWEYSIQSVGTPESDNANYQFFNTYLFPYMKGIKECKPYDKDCEIKLDPNIFENPNYTANTYSMYILTDGSCFGILTGGTGGGTANIHGWFDYNCQGKPNLAGHDQFIFFMLLGSQERYIPLQFWSKGQKLSGKKRIDIINQCKTRASDCGALIQYDGWQVADDYPVKI